MRNHQVIAAGSIEAASASRRRWLVDAFALVALGAGLPACGGGGGGGGDTPAPAPGPVGSHPPAPTSPPAPPPPPPLGNIVQYLTHDGDRLGNAFGSSAPTNSVWNNVLQFPWRRGAWGDWLDSRQVAFGTSTAGAVPYSSFAVPAPGAYSVAVTPLVGRWLAGDNRGFYLRMRNNAFPVRFAGRTSADAAARPLLRVVTSVGTFELGARCNASWATSTTQVISSSDRFELSGQSPAIVQFDLSSVRGTLVSATLQLTDIFHASGSTMANGVVDVFEADPPPFAVPTNVPNPVRGIAASLGSFQALASDPAVVFSDDFATPGWSDGGWEYHASPSGKYTPERVVNPASGTTYARGSFRAGDNGSANLRRDVSRGTGPQGTPDVVYQELYGQYWLFLEPDFGTKGLATAIKIPAMGVQFGWWNDAGYWQQTTGNGGSPGTGLKVWNAARARWEYQGHSIRILTGAQAEDDSAYANLFSVGFYAYNLDQVGPFPALENFPYVALEKGSWFCIDLHVKQNSMSGAQDADGNYAVANADGELRAWINGLPVYTRTNFRWRRHADFGVQGIWVDFYHGGVPPAPYAMHYRIDRVTLSRSYVGPPA